jgi:hypothetical protein
MIEPMELLQGIPPGGGLQKKLEGTRNRQLLIRGGPLVNTIFFMKILAAPHRFIAQVYYTKASRLIKIKSASYNPLRELD